MLITAPLALPLSKVLDWILGEEIGSVYTRERLKELLRVTNYCRFTVLNRVFTNALI